MDRWVRTNRFSGAPLDNRYTGSKSGHLDPTSFVSVQILPECNLPVKLGCLFKADRNDIVDANDLVPCTKSAQEGRMTLLLSVKRQLYNFDE